MGCLQGWDGLGWDEARGQLYRPLQPTNVRLDFAGGGWYTAACTPASLMTPCTALPACRSGPMLSRVVQLAEEIAKWEAVSDVTTLM